MARTKAGIKPDENKAQKAAGELLTGSLFDPETPGEYAVRIFRYDAGLKKVNHGMVSIEEDVEQHIIEHFGGGVYPLQLMVKGQHGAWVYSNQQREIKIAGAYRPPMGQLPGITNIAPAAHVATEAAATSGNAPGVSVDLNKLMESQAIMKMMDMMSRQGGGGTDWAPVIAAATSAIGPAVASVVGLLKNRGPDPMVAFMQDQLKQMQQQMSRMNGQPSAPIAGADISKMMAEVDQVRKLFQGREGKQDKDAPLLQTLQGFLELMMRHSNTQQPPETHQPVPAMIAPPAVSSGLPMPASTWQATLQQNKGRIFDAVSSGMAPSRAAALLYHWMNEEGLESIEELVNSTTAVQQIVAELPELEQHQSWLAQFLIELGEWMFDDEDATPATE